MRGVAGRQRHGASLCGRLESNGNGMDVVANGPPPLSTTRQTRSATGFKPSTCIRPEEKEDHTVTHAPAAGTTLAQRASAPKLLSAAP